MLGSPKSSDPRYIAVYTYIIVLYIIINLKNILYCPSLPPNGRKSGYDPECKIILSPQ